MPWYENSGPPIAVSGGVKAKSKRGAIGEQWWSRRFIAVLESYGMSGRLQRGRAYARKGQVIEFSLGTGKVTARVQGSRPAPYKVSIGVLPLTSAQWRTVEARLAAAALFRAKLLAGDMPAEIEDVFAECGTPLFPRHQSDLDMRCSCPDWEVPCKHLAAVCYVLAEAFDADPFGMLAWRGRGKEELLAALRLRPGAGRPGPGAGGSAGRGDSGGPGGSAGRGGAAGRGGSGGPGDSGGEDDAVSATRAGLGDVTGVPLPAAARNPAEFWSSGLSAARLRSLATAPPAAEAAPDLLLRMFEPPDIVVRGRTLRDILTPAYEHFAAGAVYTTRDCTTSDD